MDTFLRCRVRSGQFSGEVAVHGRTYNGDEFSLFVPDEYVDCDTPPTGESTVDGWIRVHILASDAQRLLVQLPEQSFENGRTITVAKTEVQNNVISVRRKPPAKLSETRFA